MGRLGRFKLGNIVTSADGIAVTEVPGSSRGTVHNSLEYFRTTTLQQYVGRLHRLHDGKRVVQVYDYVDSNVPMLARMYERRLKGYDIIGYTVEQQPPIASPAHAID